VALVTGATGLIGRRVVPRLAGGGWTVHCVSRRSAPNAPGVTWHAVDLGAHATVRGLMERIRPTHLLHLAWETAHGSYYTTPENVRWLADSLQLVHTFIGCGGTRVVGAGSAAEYDLAGTADLSEADTPLRPNGLYGACKKALSEVIAAYATGAGVTYGWGRIFFCYGPGEAPSRMIPALVRSLLEGRAVPFQEGRGVRDYVHADDVAAGFAALLRSETSGAVNLGSGRGIQLRDLVERIALAAGAPGAVAFGALPTPSYEPARVVADVTRARRELGWRPERSLDDGIRETVAWWRSELARSEPSAPPAAVP